MDSILFHSYFTDGFFEFGKIFTRSLFAVTSGNTPDLHLDTRGLTQSQIEDLYTCYPESKLTVNNQPIPFKNWAARARKTVPELKKCKHVVETKFKTEPTRVWKLLTAADDRISFLQKKMFDLPEGKTHIAHFDADTLLRKPLTTVKKMSNDSKTDIWLQLRPELGIIKWRITIAFILAKPTDDVKQFMDKWRQQIDSIPTYKREIGWGQTSCWLAFEQCRAKLKYKNAPPEFALPNSNSPDMTTWAGAVTGLKKAECVSIFQKEFEKQ